MRLIDADQLEMIFKNLVKSWRGTLGGPAYAAALDRVQKAPTIDAAPVVHGRWIKRQNWSVTCSVCGSLAIAHDGKNYCPYCGAKMDGGKDNGNGTEK